MTFNKRYLLLCLFFISLNIYAIDNDENIGYTYHSNVAPVYKYAYTISNTVGDIFIDPENILHVINSKGSFEFDTTGNLLKHKDELEQIPIKIDNDNNIFLRDKNILKKLGNNGKLAYTLDIQPGEEFIYIDKEENFYFLSKREIFNENLIYEREKVLDELKGILEEREKIDLKDGYYQRDIDYYKKQIENNDVKLFELKWELSKLQDLYDHTWKSNLILGDSNIIFTSKTNTTNDEKDSYSNNSKLIYDHLNNLHEDIRRKKEEINDYETKQYEFKTKIKTTQESVQEKKYELDQKDKEAKIKLRDIEEEIRVDQDKKYMIKILDNKAQVVKTIPIFKFPKVTPLWECTNITVDKDGNYYGIYMDKIIVYDFEGNPIFSVGKYGTQTGKLMKPVQIAIDSKKSIYVVDTGNNNITKFNVR